MSKKEIAVLHMLEDLDPASGGVNRSVLQLIRALEGKGVKCGLLCEKKGELLLSELKASTRKKLRLWAGNELGEAIRHCDVLHIHGLWRPLYRKAALLAKQAGKKIVCTPHGMLEPWSLAQKTLKKTFAWHLYQGNLLNTSDMIHWTSQLEKAHARKIDPWVNSEIIPWAVEKPKVTIPKKVGRQILFLSRFHKKKNPLSLVRAAAANRKALLNEGWKMIFAGPGHDAYGLKVKDLSVKLGLEAVVELRPKVEGMEKDELMRQSSLLVLPSRSENFGLVVAEALAAGLPVITTRETPWQGLEENRCGWWIDLEQRSLDLALGQALAMSDRNLSAMGKRGRSWAQKEFSLSKLGFRFEKLYRGLF